MDTKLTPEYDNTVIEQTKNYAKEKNTSLFKLIEPFDDLEVTPIVKNLSGVIDLPNNVDPKKAYKKHIINKYGK